MGSIVCRGRDDRSTRRNRRAIGLLQRSHRPTQAADLTPGLLPPALKRWRRQRRCSRVERGATTSLSLTWKLVLGFLFALVLQVAQMLIGSYFTAQMQAASMQVSDAMKASLAVQSGVDAVRQLQERIAADLEGETLRADPALYLVYLEEAEAQVRSLGQAIASVGARRFDSVGAKLGAARAELQSLQALQARADTPPQSLRDAADFFDDSVHEVEQALLRAQIEVRAIAAAGVAREREVHDLPVRASLAITLGGVVLMAVFVAWFSRQLVVPIHRAWDQLERRVTERTAELATTVQELEDQIAERRRAEQQKEELHRQLVESSRRAGMAELANGVLHNVGNVLNSVNVSANLLLDRLRQSKGDSLQRAAGLLRDHESDLVDYLTRSAQGQKLPRYLVQLAEHLAQERGVLIGETEDLTRRIDLMKEIVSRQQSYARVSGTTQHTRLSVVVEDVLRMHATSFAELDIRVETDFGWDADCELDRSRVLQILMNLVANAKQALRDGAHGGGIVRVATHAAPGDRVRISVGDNGVGIDRADLARIFAHGFTTKRDGHGFGLHHSANAAAEMGGRLWAESDGIGKGATFWLELPVRAAAPALAACATGSEVGGSET
jgi:signal transduction histidine kinase